MSCRLCHFPCGSGENIWDKFYLLELYVILMQSPIFIISPKCFHLNGNMATAIAHQRNISEIEKPGEVLS
jgi:hypothetical protein